LSYSAELIQDLHREKSITLSSFKKQYLELFQLLGPKLRSQKAIEYLNQGVLRRMKLVRRCVERIFEIFPPEREELLSSDELNDIDIHLHAFIIHISGILDNLAWVIVHERSLESAIGDRMKVGLFKPETQVHLSPEFRAYLQSPKTRKWHNRYAKNFRDALAHRIPLYLPPSTILSSDADRYQSLECQKMTALIHGDIEGSDKLGKEADSLQNVCDFFVHSFLEKSARIMLHPQLLVDCKTLVETIHEMRKDFQIAAASFDLSKTGGDSNED